VERPALIDSSRETRSSLVRWIPVLLTTGIILAYGPPEGVTRNGWWTAAVFAGTIVGFLSRPLSMGPMVLAALVTLVAAGAFGAGKHAAHAVLAGFSDETVWLVVAAFLLSGTVVRTGLGNRVALGLISVLGRTTLGLGYAIAGTELALGPIIPATTARGAGVVAPIVAGLNQVLGCSPHGNRRSTGAYLVLCGAHANLIAAALFFTGMAMNPQIGGYAYDRWQIRWDWTEWFKGSCVPGLTAMALLPWFLYRICPPDLKDAREASAEAAAELAAMGRWSWRQILLAGLLAVMVAAWATEKLHGLHSTSVTLLGIAAILALGVDGWENFTGDRAAWDALIWLGGLVTMANKLNDEGVTTWFANNVASHVSGFSGPTTAVILALIYFFSMYGFSMMTGHIAALAVPLFAVAKAADCPPLLIVAMVSYFSNLCGCLTNYSTGQVVLYFGFGYLSPQKWFSVGLAVAAFHLVIWLGIGLPYWKLLGWW
jgi:DASS family divalent anion:Na+ symporter